MHCQAASALLDFAVGNARSLLDTEVVYLSGYVLECSLKAYLLSASRVRTHETWIEKFKANRHDLDELLKWSAKKCGPFPDEMLRHYRVVRKHWSPHLRYEATPSSHSTAVAVHTAASELYFWLLEN